MSFNNDKDEEDFQLQQYLNFQTDEISDDINEMQKNGQQGSIANSQSFSLAESQILEAPQLAVDLLSNKLKAKQQCISEQDEGHKQQILHIETIQMMTKYQLVFIKLENYVNKISDIVVKRQRKFKIFAFCKLTHSRLDCKEVMALKQIQGCNKIKWIIGNLSSVYGAIKYRQKLFCFNKLQQCLFYAKNRGSLENEILFNTQQFKIQTQQKNLEFNQISNKYAEIKQTISKMAKQEEHDQLALEKKDMEIIQLKGLLQEKLKQQNEGSAANNHQSEIKENQMLNKKLTQTEQKALEFIEQITQMVQRQRK